MGELQITRRAALAALAFAAAGMAGARAQTAGLRFREIRVDVSPMRDKYQDQEAAWIAAVLPGYLRQTFAAHLAPGDRSAPILVARIDDVAFGPARVRLFGHDTTDGIEGAGIVVDGRGRVIASYPLYAAVGADSLESSPYQTAIARRRVEALALGFAQWLPGKMGL